MVSYWPFRLASWPDGFGLEESEMRARELKELLPLTAKLTPSQREQVTAYLSNELPRVRRHLQRPERHAAGSAAPPRQVA